MAVEHHHGQMGAEAGVFRERFSSRPMPSSRAFQVGDNDRRSMPAPFPSFDAVARRLRAVSPSGDQLRQPISAWGSSSTIRTLTAFSIEGFPLISQHLFYHD